MNKESHGDIVVNMLDYFRERTLSDESDAPVPYLEIQKKLLKTIEDNKRVLIDVKDSYSTQTVVVRFEYVHNRWAMGKSICYLEGKEIEIPYTIHFSDIYCKKIRVKVITEGENPFEER